MFEGERIWVTGASGFLGQHVVARLRATAAQISCERCDLLRSDAVKYALNSVAPDRVVHLAYPGSRGITTSVEEPLSLAADLLRMDVNVIEACAKVKVQKLLTVGSVCSYHEHTTLPTDESQLWEGYPEPVNAAYGMAKRMQLVLLQAARQQYGLNGVQVMLSNLYGPGDRSGHVIPATIAKIRRAQVLRGPITVWGRPEVTRSFLYVADAAEGIVRALATYDDPGPLNLCAIHEITMEHLVEQIAAVLGYTGGITYDASQPTGHTRRLFDISRLQRLLHWEPATPFEEGLTRTIEWSLEHVPLA